MKKTVKLFILIIAMMPTLLLAKPVGKINYHGRLEEAGKLVSGTKTVIFRIYNSVVGGTVLWTSGERQVSLVSGFFNYPLGHNVSFPAGLFENTVLYIELQVNGIILLPREEIYIQPYALDAGSVEWTDIKNVPIGFADGTDDGAGGAALTQDSVGTYHIIDSTITSADIVDGTLLDIDISASAGIQLSKLANDPSISGTINAVGNPVDWTRLKNVPTDFADGVDNAGGSLTADVIYSTHIAVGEVKTSDIEDGAVTQVKISSVSWSQLTDIPAGFLDGVDNTGGSLGQDSVGTYHIVNGTITASDILDGTITDGKIVSATNWNTAYGWGDHAGIGYLTTETDAVFVAAEAYNITATSTT
ncbi:hypothetical protein ACFL4A_03725, partial [bacterium]